VPLSVTWHQFLSNTDYVVIYYRIFTTSLPF